MRATIFDIAVGIDAALILIVRMPSRTTCAASRSASSKP